MKSLGKFDFQVGPHIFPDTSVYEAHYLHSTPVPQLPPSGSNQPPASTWQTASSFRTPTYTPYFPYAASATPSTTAYPSAQRASTPLVSAVASETPITPALISRVNDAASTDPILANFLQLAASGRATSDQLKTLALLIQSLASAQSSSMTRSALSGIAGSEPHSIFNLLSGQTSSSTPSTSTPVTPPSSATNSHPSSDPAQTPAPTGSQPLKEYDIVLEFPERPYDRWLVPRVPVVCERVPSTGNIEAILLLVALPFPKQAQTQKQTQTQAQTETETKTQTQTQGEPESAESATPASSDPPQEVVQFRITKVHQAFWNNIFNWVGGSTKVESNRPILERIVSPTKLLLT
jgi:hypothetical protein